jgi:polyphosphate kinase
MSANIEAISIVDNYLEHSRIYIFGNAGQTEVFISSADFMNRNLDGRVEVTCPIYDQEIKKELIDNFDLGWKGNVKARIHSDKLDNKYRERGGDPVFRAQIETYKYYQRKVELLDETF